VHHRQARQEVIDARRLFPIEPAPAPLAVHQKVRTDQQRHVGHLVERLRGEFLGYATGRIGDEAVGPGGRRGRGGQVLHDAAARQTVILDVGRVHDAAAGAQRLDDRTITGGRLPDALRQVIAFQQDQALDRLRTGEIRV
jgi:hypothetical protein